MPGNSNSSNCGEDRNAKFCALGRFLQTTAVHINVLSTVFDYSTELQELELSVVFYSHNPQSIPTKNIETERSAENLKS